MGNNTQVPNVVGGAEFQSEVGLAGERARGSGRFSSRKTVAAVLMVGAIAVLALTGLAQTNDRATAKSGRSIDVTHAPAVTPLYVPLDAGEVDRRFSFGYLVFEDDQPSGMPGFGPPPNASPRQ